MQKAPGGFAHPREESSELIPEVDFFAGDAPRDLGHELPLGKMRQQRTFLSLRRSHVKQPVVSCRAQIHSRRTGDKMATIEIAGVLKTLQGERVHIQKNLTKLDKAIAALRELSSTNSTLTQNGKRRTLSAAARRKIGEAQKARWAKVKQRRVTKG
jgi:hypothetical protein